MNVATALQIEARRPRRAQALRLLAAGLRLAALRIPSAHADYDDLRVRPVDVDVDRTASRGPIEVQVRVDGRETPLYALASRPDRWYLQAREHGHYELRVTNRTGERVGFVLAVDGLNAINGLRSNLAAGEPMYVLDPYESATVRGWRRNMK